MGITGQTANSLLYWGSNQTTILPNAMKPFSIDRVFTIYRHTFINDLSSIAYWARQSDPNELDLEAIQYAQTLGVFDE